MREDSTNEKRGVSEKDPHLETCAFKCREIFNFHLFYFLFKWGFYLIKREQVLLIKKGLILFN